VVIDELFARRFWPDETPADAIGRRVSINGIERRIVGVVGHARDDNLLSSSREQTYLPHAQNPNRFINLLVRSEIGRDRVAEAAQAAAATLDPGVPLYEIRDVDELVAESLGRRRFALLLFLAFGGVAMVLAAIGIYGVMAYSVTLRTHEIGVRVALGARPAQVLRLVVRQGLVLAAIGLGIGLATAAFLGRLVKGSLYGVGHTDPLTLLAVAALLFAVAAFASWVPARRAARIEPMEALRYE
jgi:putative ABC transport system permease protein